MRRDTRAELGAAACFGVAMVGAVALAVVYWEGGQNQAEGVLLAVVTGGIGTGIVLWAKHFLPGGGVVEDREPLASSEDERGAFRRDYEAGARAIRLEDVGRIDEEPETPAQAGAGPDAAAAAGRGADAEVEAGTRRDAEVESGPGAERDVEVAPAGTDSGARAASAGSGGATASDVEGAEEGGEPVRDRAAVRSRRLLLTSAAGALTAFGAALLFPIRSLGPRPGGGLKRTPYAAGGVRVVRDDGTPLRPDDLSRDGVLTVWPEGHTNAADSPTLLIRTRPDQEFRPRDGREDWTVDGVVAYSKLCTHVGCPVGLYQSESGLLLCPCHQSTFDVLDGARPVFGPAARSLPQLPLDVDDQGYLVARGDFSGPVGPGFWDRGR